MERAPEVVVVGAGPAGLVAAAELGRRGLDALVLERGSGVGESWRSRYEGLRLNTMRQLSAIRGMRIPRSAGRYPSREAFIEYLESYARHHRLEVRFGVTAERVDRGDDGDWRVRTDAGDVSAPHVVIAGGWDRVPVVPEWPGRESFTGELLHSAELRRPADHAGRDVLAYRIARNIPLFSGQARRVAAAVARERASAPRRSVPSAA
jgi:cation diffusion facilitator CzcD-associated flavoprotein CzcO